MNSSDHGNNNITSYWYLRNTIGALLACYRTDKLSDNTCYLGTGILGLHFIFVVIFFALTFYMVFFRFSANTKSIPTTQKLTRNKIYKICGAIMLLSFLAIGYMRYTHNRNIYLPETFAILAFATAWLVKGQTIVWDPENKPRIVEKMQDLNAK